MVRPVVLALGEAAAIIRLNQGLLWPDSGCKQVYGGAGSAQSRSQRGLQPCGNTWYIIRRRECRCYVVEPLLRLRAVHYCTCHSSLLRIKEDSKNRVRPHFRCDTQNIYALFPSLLLA